MSDESRASELLKLSLAVAVPLWIHRIRDERWPWHRIHSTAQECADIVASKGDIIQFKSKRRGETAAAFNGLARGLACASFAPGGVRFLDEHWESVADWLP